MRAIDFPEANAFYGKPESMSDEECYPVSAYQHKDENGNIVRINTVWMPNAEDVKAINEGRPVVLSFLSPILVPHSIFTYDENGSINE